MPYCIHQNEIDRTLERGFKSYYAGETWVVSAPGNDLDFPTHWTARRADGGLIALTKTVESLKASAKWNKVKLRFRVPPVRRDSFEVIESERD